MLTDEERSISLLGQEQCEITSSEGKSYYIRACLDIPIQNSNDVFTWGVWCSLSEQNYAEVSDRWDDPSRNKLGPYFGWLCTRVPTYPDTMYLKTMVHQRAVGQRPIVELEKIEHPLAVDQQVGIPIKRLQEAVVKLLHQNEK
jgi:hypothetical protein